MPDQDASGRIRHDFGSSVLGTPIPFECETHATRDEPLLGIRIDVDLGTLHELIAGIRTEAAPGRRRQSPTRCGAVDVMLTAADLAEIQDALAAIEIQVHRYSVGTQRMIDR